MRKNPRLLSFALGALLVASSRVACERPDSRDSTSASTDSGNTSAPMNVPMPRAETAPVPAVSVPVPPREALADTVITARIKAALLTDPAMQGADVSVNTDRGVVVLAGLVKSPEQTAIASAYAQRQDGVMRVDNHLAPAPQ